MCQGVKNPGIRKDSGKFYIFTKKLLLQGLRGSNSQVNGHTDHGGVTFTKVYLGKVSIPHPDFADN